MGTIYQESGGAEKIRGSWSDSAAEVGEEPEEKRKNSAQNEASDDGEIERGVFAAVDDVAGQSAEAEGEFGAEVEERADDD